MKIDVAHYTCSGGHDINEDSFLANGPVFAVADGLGGHANGEEASACAIQYLQENCKGNFDDKKILEILNAVNQAVIDLNSPARTTIAAAFVEKNEFRYANVGDSRVYYFRNGKLFAQTKDHSVCQALVDMGTLSAEDIRSSEDRSRLLKVLGNEKDLNLKKTYPVIEMQEGDAFLICSDGFWEFVYEKEMEEDLQGTNSAEQWMNRMLERQLRRAKNEDDNYTVICGRVGSGSGTDAEKNRPGIMAAALALAMVLTAGGIFHIYLKTHTAGQGSKGVEVSGSDASGSEASGSDVSESDALGSEVSENNVSAEWDSVEEGDNKDDHTEGQSSENDNNKDQTIFSEEMTE